MLTTGSVVENCRILEQIGSGGTGIIYKAYHTRLQKYVVLKRIKPAIAAKINVRAEVDILKNIKHTYLPQVYDFIVLNGEIFTVIDYIDGQSMQYYLEQQIQFPQQMLIKWAIQLCEALEYLHSQTPQIIHSDIKPNNIMITPQWDVCLIDFNISLQSDQESSLAGISQNYASPEQYIVAQKLSNNFDPSSYTSDNYYQDFAQLLGFKSIDARSDIYSLGATFYYLMTGVKPNNAVDGNVPINQLAIPYSDAFADIIEKAMTLDIDKRYQTVSAMLASLKNIIKLDKRYIDLRIKKSIVTYVVPLLIVAFSALSLFGFSTIQKEKDAEYGRLIAEGQAYFDDGNYDTALKKIADARSLKPKEIAAFHTEIKMYSAAGDYNKAISFGKDFLANPSLKKVLLEDTQISAQVNYLIGDAYFNLEQYAAAVNYYLDAVSTDKKNPDLYRDLAIAYARTGELQKAESTIARAVEYGIQDDSSLLVSGELKLAKKDYDNAIRDFKQALATTLDNDIKLRAALMLSDAYKKTVRLAEQIETLEAARQTIPPEQVAPVLQALAAAYSLKAQQDPTVKAVYEKKSLDTYLVLYQNGNPSQTLLLNIANLYQRLKDYSNAERFLLQAEAVEKNNYKVYLRFALLEADRQGTLSEDKRDYKRVKDYYDKAAVLYRPETVKGVSDPEMAQLESLIEKLKDGGWLG